MKENIPIFIANILFKFTSYFIHLNAPPVLEYDLDYSRWGKTQVGFIFHQE